MLFWDNGKRDAFMASLFFAAKKQVCTTFAMMYSEERGDDKWHIRR